MSMTTKLNVEIEDKFDKLAELDPSTKEYAVAVDSVTKLMDRAIEIEKLVVKIFIDVGSIVLPLAVTIWGARASFKFEENGTITTSVGRKFMDKIISWKR